MVEKNGPSVRCIISSTRNNRNGTKYVIYQVSQNNSPGTRCEMDYSRHKVRKRFLPGNNSIRDSGSKIQDPETIQQCITPHSTYYCELWRYHIFHIMANQILRSIIYQAPHHSHRRWATNVNHMAGKYIWCGWRLNFAQSIFNILCDVLWVSWRLSIQGAGAGVPSLVLSIDIFRTVKPHVGYEPIGIGVE